MRTMGPTEETYANWVRLLGPARTAWQDIKKQEILVTARALDKLVASGRETNGTIELRAKLLRQLRIVSRDYRDSLRESVIVSEG